MYKVEIEDHSDDWVNHLGIMLRIIQKMSDHEHEATLRCRAENERLRAILREIIGLDHHNHGPESRATKIARAALQKL
jgi:hypothetical protein